MTTRPRMVSLDNLDLTITRDMVLARAVDLPREQHAAMTEWGGPEQWFSCFYEATSGTPKTAYPPMRVPPGVTEMGIGILLSGTGTVTLTTSVDAVGTLFRTSVAADGPSLEQAYRLYAGTVLDSSAGAAGRALTVRSAVVWTFDWVDVEMIITPADDLTVYGLSFCPVHVAR